MIYYYIYILSPFFSLPLCPAPQTPWLHPSPSTGSHSKPGIVLEAGGGDRIGKILVLNQLAQGADQAVALLVPPPTPHPGGEGVVSSPDTGAKVALGGGTLEPGLKDKQ